MARGTLSAAILAVALCASGSVWADPTAHAAPPAPAVAGPKPAALPAEPPGLTRQACFGGLEDGQPILRGAASAGRYGGTTVRACRANGGSALRALRSPSIAAGRAIVT